jgi:hypothetical protein
MPTTAADIRKLDERIEAQQRRVRAAEQRFSAWLHTLNAREDRLAMSLRLLDAALCEFNSATFNRVDSRIQSDLLQLSRAREAAIKCLPSPTAQQRKGEHLLEELALHRARLRSLKSSRQTLARGVPNVVRA